MRRSSLGGDRVQAAREIVPPPNAEQKPPREIEDPSGKALDPFFRKLMAAERKDPKMWIQEIDAFLTQLATREGGAP